MAGDDRSDNCRGDRRSPDCQDDPKDNRRPQRRSIRLPEYDYALPNAYFVTMCTVQRRCLFGRVVEDVMQLSAIGRIVGEEWLRTPQMRPAISLDEHVVMPNHVHAIVVVERDTPQKGDRRSPQHGSGPSSGSLGAIIGGFKSAVTRRVHELDSRVGTIWQRNFYEHIIRSQKALDSIRSYILSNPLNWASDRENPVAAKSLKTTEPWRG
jgi:REP-associated tyrosine transposase